MCESVTLTRSLTTLRPPPKPPEPRLFQHPSTRESHTSGDPSTRIRDYDTLGKHIAHASALLHATGWDYTVRALRTPQDMPPNVKEIPHPAGRLLDHYNKRGAPAWTTTAPWTLEQRDQAIHQGPHKSALAHQAFLQDEMIAMVSRGQWMVLPYDQVRDLPRLRISPMGVVPQHDRRPRTIVDYSFHGINDETVPLFPAESMQFGHALDRILHTIVHADPAHGPVQLIKVDIADGFYRIHVAPQDIPVLGVAFPTAPGDPPLVAFPLVLPMGWGPSPPTFCVGTETAADLANMETLPFDTTSPHRLEIQAEQGDRNTTDNVFAWPETSPNQPTLPTQHFDVYVDDFIGVAQGTPEQLNNTRRKLFHCIDQVFRPVSAEDPDTRQEPISTKKLAKGDARWSHSKNILGWDVDTVQGTLALPPRRLARLHDILSELPRTKRRVALKTWQQVIGELRSMAKAIPGLRGLFSIMQDALQKEQRRRIPLSSALHDFLDDIRVLVASLATRPTRLREIVPTAPTVVGACDASGQGMGGVAFVPGPHGKEIPWLWRAPFPPDIQAQLLTYDHPGGTITNSDLELAGTIAQHDILVRGMEVAEKTLYTLSDNTPAVSRQTKGSTTTDGPAAYLLRLQALHQRQHRYMTQHSHIPGQANVMADACSRLWHLTDTQLLTHFNTTFPQDVPWQLRLLAPQMLSALTSALHKKRPELPLSLQESGPPIAPGTSGPVSALASKSTQCSETSMIPSPYSKCLHSEPGMDASPRAVDRSGLARYLRPYAKWARRSPFWGPLTLA
jgi:hypothetical protein